MLAWDVCPGEETIAAYVAGQLPQGDRDGVDSHLDTCSSCQELVASLAKLQSTRDDRVSAVDTEPAGKLGRYVLNAKLGAGGMGVVYAAYDPELDRRIALKVLRRSRAGEQLREEARAIAKLAHPNVIAVHDVGEADGEVYVAMEHVDGVTVRDWLREPHTASEILDVFVQAGRGLAAAHRAGLVHRDIKPSNIIVGNDGRARVLDFGLARGEQDGEHEVAEVAGTPAYMAPEQQRGERVDARADQYAFCVALWEALGGKRDGDTLVGKRDADDLGGKRDGDKLVGKRDGDDLGGKRDSDKLDGVSERVVRALRRGRALDPADRFPSLEPLLAELAPPPPRARRWILAAVIGTAALATALVLAVTRDREVAPCTNTGEPIAAVWNPLRRIAVRAGFVATKLPYADKAALSTIAALDQWTASWQHHAASTCKATLIDRTQPAATHALRTDCLGQLLERLRPVVAVAAKPDARVVATADSLVGSLPSPERCADIATLSALPPLPPAERDRAEIAALRAEIAEHEVGLLAGRAKHIRDRVLAVRSRADALGYAPLRARAELLVARLESASAHYDEAIAGFHEAARDATAARDLELLAEIWIELTQTLGNDVRKLDEATMFDGYATSVIAQLSNRALYELDLEFARCNRQVTAADAAQVAAHCQAAIDRAERMTPPKHAIAIASRTRLGHFLRMQGKQAEATAMLRSVVADATEFHGAQHPDVAIAHYALGIALLGEEAFDAGIAELRSALQIRRAAFPGNTVQVAESLSGLGDALASSGKHAEAITYLSDALAMLAACGEGESAQAANAHILLGMSLEELERGREALPHYIEAADIADRKLQHREAIAAMALRLAANTLRDDPVAGVPHLERAVRLLERAKASPADLGQTQLRLSEFLFEIPSEHARARAVAGAARASFVAVHASAQLAEVDRLLRAHRQ